MIQIGRPAENSLRSFTSRDPRLCDQTRPFTQEAHRRCDAILQIAPAQCSGSRFGRRISTNRSYGSIGTARRAPLSRSARIFAGRSGHRSSATHAAAPIRQANGNLSTSRTPSRRARVAPLCGLPKDFGASKPRFGSRRSHDQSAVASARELIPGIASREVEHVGIADRRSLVDGNEEQIG